MDTNANVLAGLAAFAKDHFRHDTSGHDWWHVERVWKLAKRIALDEKADVFLVGAAALLHDVADYKFGGDGGTAGRALARQWLMSLGVEESVVIQIETIIDSVSFKGAGVDTTPASLEAMIVQDADRLDAIGAIGIARTFAFGGSRGRHMHDPDVRPINHESFEAYKKSESTTINHFYEKLFLVKDRLNTKTAKGIGRKRHNYMARFLKEFHNEWDAKE